MRLDDLETDLTPDLNDQNEYETLYFTNGQLQPIIDDLQVGIFRRLRYAYIKSFLN